MDSDLYNNIPPKIKAIQEYINNEVIGLSKMKKIRARLQESILNRNNHILDLEIPFAGTYLRWEVIFSNEDINFAPDFDFINDQFLTDPDIDVIEKEIPALHNWDINNPRCLSDVVKQILHLYKKYQIDRLQVNKFERQLLEYTLLIKEMNIPEDDIEVHIDNMDCIHFLILLPIDVSVLPPYIGKYFEGSYSNPGEDSILLRVSYMNQKVQDNVWLSPHLEEVIGNARCIRLPIFSKESNLLEYIPALKDAIHDKLQLISLNHKKRNQFVSTMLAYQGRSVIEYDNVNFSKMTLLLEAQDNCCLVTIQMTKYFYKPTIQLRSLYCEKNSKPLTENLHYPYSADATIEDTVKKILTTIYRYLTTYKVESNNSHNKFNHTNTEKFSYATALQNK